MSGCNLTITDTLFSVEAALEGIALAYTFEQLALSHLKAKKLRRVLTTFSPDVSGFLSLLPEQAAAATQAEGFRGLCARSFPQALTRGKVTLVASMQ